MANKRKTTKTTTALASIQPVPASELKLEQEIATNLRHAVNRYVIEIQSLKSQINSLEDEYNKVSAEVKNAYLFINGLQTGLEQFKVNYRALNN